MVRFECQESISSCQPDRAIDARDIADDNDEERRGGPRRVVVGGSMVSKARREKDGQSYLTPEQRAWIREHAEQLDDMDCRPGFDRQTGIRDPEYIKRLIQEAKKP